MRILLGLCAAGALMLGAGQVMAAGRTCSGDADGVQGADLTVSFPFDNAGAPGPRTAIWTPPSNGADLERALRIVSGGTLLMVEYDVPDARLPKPRAANAFAIMNLQDAPVSRRAEIVVTLDGGRVWRLPLNSFAGLADKARARRGKKSTDINVDVETIAGEDSSKQTVRPDLLDALETARSITLTIEGDAGGETFGSVTYDLSDHAARDALFAKAYADAAKAAEKPNRCKKD
jgi:hypothetical protein